MSSILTDPLYDSTLKFIDKSNVNELQKHLRRTMEGFTVVREKIEDIQNILDANQDLAARGASNLRNIQAVESGLLYEFLRFLLMLQKDLHNSVEAVDLVLNHRSQVERKFYQDQLTSLMKASEPDTKSPPTAPTT